MFADLVDIMSIHTIADNSTISVCGYVRKVFHIFSLLKID